MRRVADAYFGDGPTAQALLDTWFEVVASRGPQICVVAVGLFDTGAQFGTSSAALSANQYFVFGRRTVIVTSFVVSGSPGTLIVMRVAVAKFVAVIAPAVLIRRSYVVALPVTPSSPRGIHHTAGN